MRSIPTHHSIIKEEDDGIQEASASYNYSICKQTSPIKTKAAVKKCNLVPLTRPDRAKLAQPRRLNVGPLPEATRQNWTSNLGKARDVAGTTTRLAPIKGSQVMDTSPIPSPTSPVVPTKTTGHSKYCLICMPLGKICPEEFAMSLDWDGDEEDQSRNKVKDNNQDQTQTSPNFSMVMTITLKPPKHFINKYFDSISNETPIVCTPRKKCICDTITSNGYVHTHNSEHAKSIPTNGHLQINIGHSGHALNSEHALRSS